MQSDTAVMIEELKLEDIASFDFLEIKFAPSFNIICGENGVGKTTILSAIARAFSFHQSNSIRRRAAAAQPGRWNLVVRNGPHIRKAHGTSEGLLPTQQDNIELMVHDLGKHILHFKANRDFLYSPLGQISRDPEANQQYFSEAAQTGVQQYDLKRWLANRYLFSAHKGSLSDREEQNLAYAKDCFSILDPKVKFERVDAATFDTFVSTSQGSVPFEYLSSGFRASLALLLGIIREIEVRGFQYSADNFDGVILIDELDLHLHPSWQQKIASALKNAFPLAQFIITTHSPHVIQHADQGEVLPVVRDEFGSCKIEKMHTSKYGFKGWTVEEILRDVMGVEHTQTVEYLEQMRSFDDAVDRNDARQVDYAIAELELMLNPNNNLRKLLRIQAAALGVKID